MSVTTTNLTSGPGTYFDAPFGTAEPTLGAAPGAGWVDVGGTADGITQTISEEFIELEVDQLGETPERRRTKREASFKTNLAETTLEMLALTLNEPAPAAAVSGVQSFDVTSSESAAFWKPPYRACLFDGPGAGGQTVRLVLRKTLSTDGTEFAYKKDGQRMFSVTRTGHYVSPAIRPFSYKVIPTL